MSPWVKTNINHHTAPLSLITHVGRDLRAVLASIYGSLLDVASVVVLNLTAWLASIGTAFVALPDSRVP
jgi:hypothetical protein